MWPQWLPPAFRLLGAGLELLLLFCCQRFLSVLFPSEVSSLASIRLQYKLPALSIDACEELLQRTLRLLDLLALSLQQSGSSCWLG